jgi:hypothetical protein
MNWEPVTDLSFGLGAVDDDCVPNFYDTSWDLIVFQDKLYLLPLDKCRSLPGVIMRSSDGESWESVATAKELGMLSIDYGRFVKLGVFNDALYVNMDYFDPETDFPTAVVFRSPSGDPGTWDEVMRFPGLASGTFQTFKDALYMASWNAWAPPHMQPAPDQIWRTFDGVKWEMVVGDGFGNPGSDEMGAFAEYKGYLYVGEGTSEGGGGQIWRTQDGLQWEPVIKDGFGNPSNFMIDGLVVYDGKLYAYTVNWDEGCTIYVTEDANTWERVNEPGWGNPKFITSYHTSAQAVFKDELYMGVFGENGVLLKNAKPVPSLVPPTATPLPSTVARKSPTPESYPLPRLYSPIVYSPKADQALLFGGMRWDQAGSTATDAWLFDPQTLKMENDTEHTRRLRFI